MNHLLFSFFWLCFLLTNYLQAIDKKIFSEDAIEARSIFWHSFQSYQSEILEQADKKYHADKSQLVTNRKKATLEFDAQKAVTLLQAINTYKENIKDQKTSLDPYNKANLISVMYLYQAVINQSDPTKAKETVHEALILCSQIIADYPIFERLDMVLYVQALLFLANQDWPAAWQVFTKLAKNGQNSDYTVYANLALGDEYYFNENPQESLKFYEKSLAICTNNTNQENLLKDSLAFEIQSRILIAAYRAHDYTKASQFAAAILRTTSVSLPKDRLEQEKQDAAFIIAESFYKKRSLQETKDFLLKEKNHPSFAAIFPRLIQNYFEDKSYKAVVAFTDLSEKTFLLTEFSPLILSLKAKALAMLAQDNNYLHTLEEIANFLPADSLFMARYRHNKVAVLSAKTFGMWALEAAASIRLEQGLKTKSLIDLKIAKDHFSNLLSLFPTDKNAIYWETNLANSAYFSGNFEEACLAYTRLLDGKKLDEKNEKLLFYRLVLARQGIYNKAYKLNLESNIKPNSNNLELVLNKLEEISLKFFYSYPDSEEAIDSLANAANFYEENKLFQKAESIWKKIIATKTTPYIRRIALRGILYTSIKSNRAIDAAKKIHNILLLEDFNYVGPDLRKELLAIYSKTLLEAAKTQKSNMNFIEAAELLCSALIDFPEIPNGYRMYKEGTSLYGVEGAWSEVAKRATYYLSQDFDEYVNEMRFLFAKSLENQFFFQKAAQAYYALAMHHHYYPKFIFSLEKTSLLASYEENYQLAAKAEQALAKATKDRKESLHHYRKASELFAKANLFKEASDIDAYLISSAKTLDERLYAKLNYSQNIKEFGYPKEAYIELENLLAALKANKERLGEGSLADLWGKTHLELGQYHAQILDQELAKDIHSALNTYHKLKFHYLEASKSDHLLWSPKARFKLAQKTGQIVKNILLRKDEIYESFSESDKNKMETFINSSKNFSQDLLNENILEGYRWGQVASHNIWILQSSYLLGQNAAFLQNRPFAPSSLAYPLPIKWRI